MILSCLCGGLCSAFFFFLVLPTFDRKCLAKVKKLWVQKPFIIECFKNVLCILFIKRLMINFRKTLQMNILMSE